MIVSSTALTEHLQGSALLSPPRGNLKNGNKPGTPYSSVSTLTPDSNYKNIKNHAPNNHHYNGHLSNHSLLGEGDEHSVSEMSYAPSEGTMMSGFSKIDFLLYENDVIKQAAHDPKVLIGWRVLVKGLGSGTVLSIKKTTFSSTKFVIQFDDGSIQKLSLKRSETKGKIPFTLISKGAP